MHHSMTEKVALSHNGPFMTPEQPEIVKPASVTLRPGIQNGDISTPDGGESGEDH